MYGECKWHRVCKTKSSINTETLKMNHSNKPRSCSSSVSRNNGGGDDGTTTTIIIIAER